MKEQTRRRKCECGAVLEIGLEFDADNKVQTIHWRTVQPIGQTLESWDTLDFIVNTGSRYFSARCTQCKRKTTLSTFRA